MADGFKDLEEFVMGVLVRERKTTTHTIADANEILGVIVDRCTRIVQAWHFKKGGYVELAETLRALAQDPVQVSRDQES